MAKQRQYDVPYVTATGKKGKVKVKADNAAAAKKTAKNSRKTAKIGDPKFTKWVGTASKK
jgi:hypothetical protein